MEKIVIKRTKHDTEFVLKLEDDKVMIKYSGTLTNNFVLLTDYLDEKRLTNHEKIVLMNGLYDLGFSLIYKPFLIKHKL